MTHPKFETLDFDLLTPVQFENLTFDLLQAAGLRNVVWRTPGADGGRDIEGTFLSVDFSAHLQHQSWYVECKKYANSIDWPTIWRKIGYAENNGANFLLLVTNSNPSPACEAEISKWNASGKSLALRVWRGYELSSILRNYPHVAAKFGLLGPSSIAGFSLQSMMFDAMKLAQSLYTSDHLEIPNTSAVEAMAALSELIFTRHSQLKADGRMAVSCVDYPPEYTWLSWQGEANWWDEVGIRAILTMIRHLSGCSAIFAISNETQLSLYLREPRIIISRIAEKTLFEIAMWADVEVTSVSENNIVLARRAE